MAPSIKPPQITGPRPRIPVSEQDRKAAMAGMGGEKTKTGADSPTAEPLPVSPPEPAPIVPAVSAEVVTPPAPPTIPAPVDEHPAPVPVESTPAPLALTPAPSAAPATTARRRGRPPRVVEDDSLSTSEQERSIRISQRVWKAIKKNLVNLPEGPDMPTNIKKYLELAHLTYEATLRKEGKLPAKQAEDK
jgi:hypothetical protein